MKLLICTQKVDKNDPVLGFFHGWIIEFAKHFESIIVICLQKGEYDLPANVKVLSLGKEDRVSRIVYMWRFYKYIWEERRNYDKVFVHMNPVYVILGWKIWRLYSKKIYLWYTHKHIDLKLRIAALCAHTIFTASKESFRLKSHKVRVVGHGIDTQLFSPASQPIANECVIVSVSRISSTKNQLILLEALNVLKEKNIKARLIIAGGPVTSGDVTYELMLKSYVAEHSLETYVEFVGPVTPEQVVAVYRRGTLFINLSSTGSLDKAVLEAMACGLQVITSNEAFKSVVEVEYVASVEPGIIAEQIICFSQKKVGDAARQYVIKNHNLEKLIDNLSKLISI